MKTLFVLLLVGGCVNAASTNTTKKPEAAPAEKREIQALDQSSKSKEPNALDKKEEDCDTKAKKPVEVTPESISLSGTTGCSLDEAKP